LTIARAATTGLGVDDALAKPQAEFKFSIQFSRAAEVAAYARF